ncbi:metallophosphoesterase [Serpentinicella alkaliphila]|uniref:metallophosphoesterase n=1 Tax=Serpentinicella alkaliphila TaxID=1734049 RepID=UPI001051E275|nr:metallophosphoesterase [Serpentinicella alkaliphila]QUH25945.1 metallophosphoesterase [Serpentinicella alkaliphila]
MWILFIAKDIVNLFVRTIFGRHNIIEENKKLINLTIIILSVILVAYGAINAKRPRIVEYSIDINKKVENIDQMKVVLISDLHIGQIVGNRFLRNIVNIVNSLEPDLILIPGDIIDDNLHENIQVKIGDILKDLNSTYGVYASLGNHEFIGGQADEIEEYLNSVNINVLRDEALKVADSFYIIGREDKASERFTNIHRRELSDIMLEIDRLNPIFMLDHQPIDIVMARDEGVDLQVSGHTHRGQILPGRFFTKRIFDVDWGLYKESSYHLIVTSGAGTWGPPIRIGTNSEVVLININFN